MCFILDRKSFPRIALKDIKVQKLFIRVNSRFISPYQEFEYKKGVTYKSKFKFEFDSVLYNIHINEGLHSYTKKIKITINNDLYVKECIIPKGSIYFVNKDNEVVSNKLKLI